MIINNEKSLMKRVFKLALKGRGHVSPNPRVGALIVDDNGLILSEGYHHRCGEPHAEIMAMQNLTQEQLRGKTLFVNLEPCCHHGRTPPCSEAIIKAGIKKVFTSNRDPNPKVNGKGFQQLRDAGIEVVDSVLEDKGRCINRGYFSYKIRHRAWCVAKIALSIDGKMANREGMSKWITCEEARKLAHAMRADHDAIMVGSGTVHHDNPELTTRLVRGANPARVILAPGYGIPHQSTLARTANEVRTILLTTDDVDPPGTDIADITVIRFPKNEKGSIDPELILKKLPEYGILSLMIEGGSHVLSSFMQAEMIDELVIATAPSIVGEGISPFEHFTPESWEWRPRYVVDKIKRAGTDTITTYRREGDPFSLD